LEFKHPNGLKSYLFFPLRHYDCVEHTKVEMKKRSFFKEVVLLQGDGQSQGIGILLWIVILLTLTALILSFWLMIKHPDKFEEVMRMWGLWLE